MDNIIKYIDRAKDFGGNSLVPVLDPAGTGDYGQEARQAQIRNEAADSVSEWLNSPEYLEQNPPVEEKGFFESAWSSIADPWRQANVQGHEVNLGKKQWELTTTEAKWVPEIEQAEQYLSYKQELIDLTKDIEVNGNNWSQGQLQSALTRQRQLNMQLGMLEPELKNSARTNPYLQDIFYETSPGKLFENKEAFGGISNALKYLTYDYVNSAFSADLNPTNNFKHMLQYDGVEDPIFGRVGQLSPEQLEFMWGSRNKDDVNTLSSQLSQVKDALAVAGTVKKEKEEDILAKVNTIKKGNWLFDPTKIDPQFKAKFQNNEISATDPSSWYYALPHLGSSYSEFGAMLGQMTASTLLNYAAKGALAATTGGTLPLMYAMTEAGVNLAIASYMRDSETSSEAFSAYQEKILNAANKNGINIEQVIGEATDTLKKLGYDTDNMDDYELFQASVAQQLKTSNPYYNELLESSKEGIDMLVQTNSALSIPDYIESTLFSYGGSYLSKAYGLKRTLGKAPNAAFDAAMKSSVANRELAEASEGIIDRTITRVADKLAKNPMGKVAARTRLNTLVKLGKAAGLSYFSERTEEGVQNLVSTRYKNGEYNNSENYSLLNGIANAAQLGIEANLAYYGIHPDNTLNTDKDLKNEMAIGGFTGLFMTGVYGSRSTYEGIKQALTDNKLKALTADHYGDAERDAKVEQFINASKKNKNNFGAIRNSLESLKRYKPEGVTDEMINEDIELANAIQVFTSNKKFNGIAQELGADYGTSDYTKIVKTALNLRDRMTDQQKASKQSTNKVQELEDRIRKDEVLSSTLDQFYEQYVQEQKNKAQREQQTQEISYDEYAGNTEYQPTTVQAPEPIIIDKETYKQRAIDNLLNIANIKAINRLDNELTKRKNDLEKVKKDFNLDVNTDGISSIHEYVKSLREQYPNLGEDVTKSFDDMKLSFADELETALAEKYINEGAFADLFQHSRAYTTGEYHGNARMFKPIWKNLTKQQQEQILSKAAEEDQLSNKEPRTRKQVIATYNNMVNQEWAKDEDLADQRDVAKRRAKQVIQYDLIRRDQKEEEAVQEKKEEQGTPATEPVVTETTQSEEVEAATETETPPMDTMTEDISEVVVTPEQKPTAVTNIEALLDELESTQDSELAVPDEVEVVDQEEAAAFDNAVEINAGIAAREEVENNLIEPDGEERIAAETDAVEEVTSTNEDSAEEVTDKDKQDSAIEQKEQKLEQVEEKDEEGGSEQSDEPTDTSVTEVIPTPTAEPSQIPGVPESEAETPTFETGTANEIFVDPTTQEVMWDPTGAMDKNNAVVVNEQDLVEQEIFDRVQNMDQFEGPATYQNRTADVDEINPVVTKNKQKKRHIANTFFYLPTTDEIMPIRVAGKDVTFIAKNGKPAERRPGSELADNLAVPGWLSTVDDAYYVVTSSTHQMTQGQALDNLAVHLIIEKDGKVYNTSLRAISDQLRKDLLALGMKQEDVDAQIEALRALRTKIIKSYAPNYFIDGKLPLQAAKQAKPTNMRISNGLLNNQIDENGNPSFRSLTEVEDFGIPTDPQQMSEMIESNEIELGYGTGPFGTIPFEIVRLDQKEATSVQGRGYAGKIYIVPKVENTPSQTTTLPIMLSEELHRIPNVERSEDIQLSKNPDGTINRGEDGKPIPMTTAELIYELLVNGVYTPELDNFLLDILANHGSKTVMTGLEDVEKNTFNFLIRKQLHVYTNPQGKRFLINGSLRRTDRPELGYTTKFTDLDKITYQQKRKIVWEISQNIHWNTDKDALLSPISEKVVNAIISVITSRPELMPKTEDEQIRFGSDDTTFSLRDLGYSLIDGKPVKKEGNTPLLISWFINHKKLKTDIGQRAFSAPFVYTDDVVVDNTAREQVKAPQTTVTSKGEAISTQQPATTPTTEKKKGRTPTIAEPATPENLEKYGLTIPTNQVLLKGSAWAIITDKKTGKKKVTQAPRDKVAGLFSTVKGKGELNAKEARKWLVDTLGLDPSDVITTKAVIATLSDGKVYGLMRVAVNTLQGELTPQILLSKESGEGVEFHEAFHYVSMLLLTPSERRIIYQQYMDTNPDAESLSNAQVEEALAEQFRAYMLNEKNPTIGYRVKKFFKRIKNYIRHLFGREDIIQNLFSAIRKGAFKDMKPSREALEQVYKEYPTGVRYYIPGVPQEQLEKMPNILDPDTFYNIAQSLTSTALAMYNIRSVEDVHNLNVDSMFDNIQDRLDNDWLDESIVPLVEDVLENKDIFRQKILAKLNQLGIREIDKVETQEKERLEIENGDIPDNVWDKNQGEISKKDNISFRAKLFFYSVPKYQYVFVKDENTGIVTKEITPVTDDIFGLPVSEEFNVVWNKLMENLWDIDTYQDIIDNSARLAETDPTFYAVHEMLTSEENPLDDNTKTQLEITIKSSKVQMNTLEEHPDKPNISPDMRNNNMEDAIEDEIQAALKRSIWELNDSDTLRKIAKLPPAWSRAFFASDNVVTDQFGGRSINENAAKYVSTRRSRINKLISEINIAKRKKQELKDIELKLQQMKDAFLEICNSLCIPFDAAALDYMLNNIADDNATSNPTLNKFMRFWSTKDKNSFNGSVLGNIEQLARTKRSYIKARGGEGKSRTLDRIFNYGDPEAQINLMAIAYGKMHPSPQEFSVVGADGALIYPISENNFMTDQIRNINKDANGKRQQIIDTPYSHRSLIANSQGVKFKLHNFLALKTPKSSRDYFGISPVEDYISKLTLTTNDQMILPTMSDKKTWYSISGLTLIHDTLSSKIADEGVMNYYAILGQEAPIDELYVKAGRRFSDSTLSIFVNYWLDEFDAVFDYYKHKDYVAAHPTLRVDNYHGKIKNGKMDASGNGGRFRYFSSLRLKPDAENPQGRVINLNEDLADLEQNGTTEEVMKYLQDLKVLVTEISNPQSTEPISNKSNIYEAMNNLLVGATNRELNALTKRGIVEFRNGYFANRLIPYSLWKAQEKVSKADKNKYRSDEVAIANEDILYSIIGSHVANQALSIIELEKCFTGDPAYYKWKKTKKEVKDADGNLVTSYDIITGRDVDKIKRLSAVLSTGTNLRTVWDNPKENDTTVTVMHLKDNEIGSDYHGQLYDIFRNSILRDLYSDRYPNKTDDEIIEALNTKEKEDAFYKTLKKEQQKFVDTYSNNSARPYAYEKNEKGEITGGNINQSDAAVYVRPALYRRIMKALGNWSDQIEEAYNIMEGEDESWMQDPKLYSKVQSALIKPLKMVYFGDHREQALNLNIPVFDKMAMFPMFKMLAKGDNELLYNRMNNEELGVIDMLTFESAVKVGGRPKYQTYEDATNEHLNTKDLTKPSYAKFGQEGNLPVFKQDIGNLRLQLNTDPHEHIDRSFGTQAVKICLGNLIDTRTYGLNKGKSVKGSDLKTQVMEAINRLTIRGADEVVNRFFYKGSLNNKALSDFLVSQAQSSGMSDEVVDGFRLDEDGNFKIPLAATSSRTWIESRLTSYVNKKVVDLNTPGGAAIQMSAFGFKATDKTVKQKAVGRAFNDGKKLRFLNKDGSMDIMISTNFFRHIVPEEYQDSYGRMKQWLITNNIIGTNSVPQGVGYRIPTQGLSSTFSFKIVDVLPDRVGDTVVVPDEFTAMTGSDFDVDKLYIAMLNYDENGNVIQYQTDEEGNELPAHKQNDKALQNKIIQSYQLVVSDNKNMAETRASIDTLTGILQKDILPLIQPASKEQALPMYELLPSFQLSRKEEYTGGKAGIGPFALNSTNHVLTQLTHLVMNYSKGNPYKLGALDAVRGRDGYRILDWLSAMINAHVDVAKDPYIMTLNVNKITYNTTNLLLRGGMGKSTFYFLAQPILKRFTATMIANEGDYGVQEGTYQNTVIAALYKLYFDGMKNAIEAMPAGSQERVMWEGRYNGMAIDLRIDPIGDPVSNTIPMDRDMVFDEALLQKSLKDKNSIESMYQQIITMRAYNELQADAQVLADLVSRSQIDTKKYGNTLSQQMNFRNSYETFIYDNGPLFTIRGEEYDAKDPEKALRTYFGKTFLATKLHHGTTLPRKLLKDQVFPATKTFESIFTSVMGIFGEPKTILKKDGSETLAYKHNGNKKFIDRFSSKVDSIIRARLSRDIPALHATDEELVSMLYGSNTMCRRLTGIKQYILENKDQFPTLINQDGTFINQLLNYLQEYPGDGDIQLIDRIVLSDSSLRNDYDTENQLVSAFAELLNSEDNIVRDFANDLAKYAYLTSYDERGSNSFFQLVPNSWKLQNGYIQAIKDGLGQFRNDSNEAYQIIAEENDNAEAKYFPSINIAIARNLWQDDDIVSPFNMDDTKGDRYLHRSSTQVGNRSLLVTNVFATSRTRGKEYVKMTFGKGDNKTTELYRMVGVAMYENEEGAPVKKGRKFIYQRIPKLGIMDNGFRVNEFQKESLEASAFKQNAFDYDAMLTGEQIEWMAVNKALKTPSKGSGFNRVFVSSNPDTIKYKMEQDAKEIAGVQDGTSVVETVMSIGEDNGVVAVNDFITPEMEAEAVEFVYGTMEQDFDATEAIMDVANTVEDVGSLSELFAAQSESPTTAMEMQEPIQTEDMNAIVELAKKRKKECENAVFKYK